MKISLRYLWGRERKIISTGRTPEDTTTFQCVNNGTLEGCVERIQHRQRRRKGTEVERTKWERKTTSHRSLSKDCLPPLKKLSKEFKLYGVCKIKKTIWTTYQTTTHFKIQFFQKIILKLLEPGIRR